MPDKKRLYVADAHCDTITRLTSLEMALGCLEAAEGHLDFPRLCQRVKLQFMAFFLHQATPEQAWQHLRRLRRNLQIAMELHGGLELLLDWRQAGCGRNTQLVLAVEGLDLLDNAFGFAAPTEELYRLGFRSLGLFWNNNNFLGCGADALGEADTGLTAAGSDFIRYAEKRGFLLDLAHASAKSFWQAAALLRQPIFVSHACCAVLCPHRRNLTDEQLRALGQSGGWLGVTLAPAFLRASTAENAADLDDVVRHIQHAVNVAGAESVGLGSDFDGVENLPKGIVGVQSWPRLADALTAAGFKADMVERLLGGNLLKFLRRHGSEITQ